MLDLAPETEHRVHTFAAHEGVTVDEAINRLLRASVPPRTPIVPADDPVLAFLQAQLREAENATPEEQAEAEAEWQTFAQNMNENRRVNGERLLYPEVLPS